MNESTSSIVGFILFIMFLIFIFGYIIFNLGGYKELADDEGKRSNVDKNYNFSFIEEPQKKLKVNVKRKVIIKGTRFCVQEKDIKRCEHIDMIGRFVNVDYDINMDYTVIFDMSYPQVIIINEDEDEKPIILFQKIEVRDEE